jgi:hypothetical protein
VSVDRQRLKSGSSFGEQGSQDGRLNLSVDVDVADADVAVVVTVTPVTGGSDVDENGWPDGFFDRVAGSMPELRRGSQGEFEERLPLE